MTDHTRSTAADHAETGNAQSADDTGIPQAPAAPASPQADAGNTADPGPGGTGPGGPGSAPPHAPAPHAPAPGLGRTGWQPTPQGGEYDADATAFVQLPPGFDFSGTGDPLAAPGHDYVPPHISAPLETGTWNVHLHQDPQAYPPQPYQPHDTHRPPEHQPSAHQPSAGWPDAGHDAGATSQWNFSEALDAAPAPAAPAAAPVTAPVPAQASAPEASSGPPTGQWTIPVAEDESPEDSGEFPAAQAAPWHSPGAPATLPGGAPAPWALPTTQPTGAPQPTGATEPTEPARSADAARGPLTGTPADGTHLAALAPQDPTSPAGTEATAGTEQQPHDGDQEPSDPTSDEAPVPDPAPAPTADAAPDPASDDQAPALDGTADADTGTSGTDASEIDTSETDGAAADTGNTEPGPDPAPGTDSTPDAGPGYAFDAVAGIEPSYAAPHEPAPFRNEPSEHPSASYVLRVNGADRPVTEAWIGESLLYVLRERLGLAGAKDGCSQGECGACAVQVDGRLVASCLVPAATTAGSEVRTVEGLATDGEPSDVQRALANCGAVQCGFCIPGMAMTVHDLLEGNHAPTDLETRQALCGNLCRCSGYRGVLEAVREVVTEREASAEAAAAGHTTDEARIPHQAPPGAGSVQHTLHHPHDGGMA